MRFTYTELNRNAEEVASGGLLDLGTALDTRQIDEGRLYNALFSVHGLDDLFSEAEAGVGHGQGGGSETTLGLDDLVATELDTCR